jgi:hypothetical protein
MIGYVDSVPEDIEIIGNPPSEWLADLTIDCRDAYVPGLPGAKTIDAASMNSDHASFWLAGYCALELIEDSPPVYPLYHTTGDTLGNLNQSFATEVVKLAVATLAELAIPDSAVAGIGSEVTAAISRVHPNPFSASTTISLTALIGTDLEVSVFNIEGKLVRRLSAEHTAPGRYDLTWDGRNDAGLDASPGVYFVRLAARGAEASTKVVLIR